MNSYTYVYIVHCILHLYGTHVHVMYLCVMGMWVLIKTNMCVCVRVCTCVYVCVCVHVPLGRRGCA